MKWFQEVKDMTELRVQYKKMLLKHHPDNGGQVSDMQKINEEYDLLFSVLSNQTNKNNQSYTNEENILFKAVLNEIIGFNMTVEIIGSWIWCFNCYQYKDRLKELGFKFAPKKKAWCWHYGNYKRYHKVEVSLDDIRAKYGSQTINSYQKQAVIS